LSILIWKYSHPPQRRVEAVEHDALIADDSAGPVHRMRIHAPRIYVLLGACDEEGSSSMHCVQPHEVHISAVYDVETASLDKKNVQHADIVQLAIADVDERWNRTAQVQRGILLDGCLGRSKRRPVKQTQA